MSYQVLARKWRPKKFQELMGQEHVVNVLVNALTQQRLHHAYLFTGTRGVGKTTIARIFAKSLNCLEGVSAEPCGVCDACTDIDLGRFVDLLEIDAASRTKVDDTREILDNVQYAPSRGRYKVYLIDEVHMLSRSSFNALLKTLEEPPEHVKFILATTDPQKLPVTVLSRCLQFHLKALTSQQIKAQLAAILSAEQVESEDTALSLLAKAARGSMRDGLSLTDQALAQGQGTILTSNVQQMLGGVDQHWPYKILIALIKQNTEELMALSLEIASYSPNYGRLLAEFIQLLHQIAISQVVGNQFDLSPEHQKLQSKFCQAMSPEDVQLYYQIALNGRKDLPYAIDEQAAFDMTLLRLAAFQPQANLSKSALTQEQNNQQPIEEVTQSADVDFSDVALESTEINQPESSVINNIGEAQLPEQNTQIAQEHHLSPEVESEEGVENDDMLQQLAAEQMSIEQQAIDQGFAANTASQAPELEVTEHQHQPQFESVDAQYSEANYQQSPASSVEKNDGPLNAESETVVDLGLSSSPVAAVLASRNMLRSKKKQQEKQTKKSDDAIERPQTAVQNEKPADVPELTDIHEEQYTPEVIDPATIRSANQVDKWANMIDHMQLNGRLRQLAIHATISQASNDNHLVLALNQSTKHLQSDAAHQQLQESLSALLKRDITVDIQVVEETVADPYQIQTDINNKRYQYAKELLQNDNVVQHLQTHFQATLDEESIVAK